MLAACLDLTGEDVPLTVPHHPRLFCPCLRADRIDGDMDVIIVRVAMDGDQAVVALQKRLGESPPFLHKVVHGQFTPIRRRMAEYIFVALAVAGLVVFAVAQVGTAAGGRPPLRRCRCSISSQVQRGAVAAGLHQAVFIQNWHIISGAAVLPMPTGVVLQHILIAGVFGAAMLDDSHR